MTITDRILWETNLGINIDAITNKFSDDKTKWARIDKYYLNSRISFFLENSLDLYIDLRTEMIKYRPEKTATPIFMDFFSYSSFYLPDRYIYDSDFEREISWGLSLGVRYYFGSGLR